MKLVSSGGLPLALRREGQAIPAGSARFSFPIRKSHEEFSVVLADLKNVAPGTYPVKLMLSGKTFWRTKQGEWPLTAEWKFEEPRLKVETRLTRPRRVYCVGKPVDHVATTTIGLSAARLKTTKKVVISLPKKERFFRLKIAGQQKLTVGPLHLDPNTTQEVQIVGGTPERAAMYRTRLYVYSDLLGGGHEDDVAIRVGGKTSAICTWNDFKPTVGKPMGSVGTIGVTNDDVAAESGYKYTVAITETQNLKNAKLVASDGRSGASLSFACSPDAIAIEIYGGVPIKGGQAKIAVKVSGAKTLPSNTDEAGKPYHGRTFIKTFGVLEALFRAKKVHDTAWQPPKSFDADEAEEEIEEPEMPQDAAAEEEEKRKADTVTRIVVGEKVYSRWYVNLESIGASAPSTLDLVAKDLKWDPDGDDPDLPPVGDVIRFWVDVNGITIPFDKTGRAAKVPCPLLGNPVKLRIMAQAVKEIDGDLGVTGRFVLENLQGEVTPRFVSPPPEDLWFRIGQVEPLGLFALDHEGRLLGRMNFGVIRRDQTGTTHTALMLRWNLPLAELDPEESNVVEQIYRLKTAKFALQALPAHIKRAGRLVVTDDEGKPLEEIPVVGERTLFLQTKGRIGPEVNRPLISSAKRTADTEIRVEQASSEEEEGEEGEKPKDAAIPPTVGLRHQLTLEQTVAPWVVVLVALGLILVVAGIIMYVRYSR
ncbi:MAG: hypothetical protein HQ582_05520, partial [Planctomycetes bacterium]|nr:hypothetical protein [Planctomycetota bacterium]